MGEDMTNIKWAEICYNVNHFHLWPRQEILTYDFWPQVPNVEIWSYWWVITTH